MTVPDLPRAEIFLQNVHRGMSLQCRNLEKNDFVVFKENDYHLLHGLDFAKVKVHDARPNAVQKAILEADDLLVQKGKHRRNERERIANWRPDFTELEGTTLATYRKVKNCLRKI